VQSPILFHQMIGRGTRIYEPDKLMFRILDYAGALETSQPGRQRPTTLGGRGGDFGSGHPRSSFAAGWFQGFAALA
jgi:hypothetical protein